MRRKRIPGAALPILIVLILFYLFFPRHSFQDFTMDIFQREISQNTLNLHYTLTDPASYGIEETSVTLGNFGKEALDSELSYLEDCQAQLKKYQEKGLSSRNQLTAEVLIGGSKDSSF